MSRVKKIALGALGLIVSCCTCVGGINIADRLGFMAEPSPTLSPTNKPIVLNTEVPTDTPVAMTAIEEAPSPTVIPTETPAATPTQIAVLLPIIQNAPTPTLSPIAGVACIPLDTLHQEGTVINVIDGDTIEVQIDGSNYKVRYIGMDSPEADSPFGELAKARNAELVSGKTVLLVIDVSDIDPFDRLLRYVVADSLFVNQLLVAEGYAVAKDYPPDTACSSELTNAQNLAMQNSVGVWAPQPTTQSSTGSESGGEIEEAVCQCTGNLYNCGDFNRQAKAQACYEYCKSLGLGDIHRLDGSDKDGRVCESLP